MLTFGYVTVNLTEYSRAKISILCGLMHVTLHILPFLRDRYSAIWGTFYIWLSMLLPFVQLNLLLIAGYSPSVFCCLLGYLKMAFSVFVTLTQKCQSLTGYNYKNSWDISIILSVLCLYLKALSNRAKTIAKHLDLNFSCHYLVEWMRKVEIRIRKEFLAVGEACVAIVWPTLGFKGRTFVSSGFSTEGIF